MASALRRIIPLLLLLAALVYGGYRIYTDQLAARSTALKGAGNIEATEITVAGESMGRIKAVHAEDGDVVRAGDLLVEFDDALLRAQLKQAEANLRAARSNQAAAEANAAAAQANLEQVRAGARPQELAAAEQSVAAAAGRVGAAEDQLAQSRGALQAAEAARAQAVAAYSRLKQGARPEQITAASVQVEQATAALQTAQANYDKVAGRPDVGMLPQSTALQQASLALEAAQAAYDGLLRGATTPELDQARAGISQAQAGIIQATAVVSQTQSLLSTAQAGLAGEQARLDLVKAGARPEQLKAAEAQAAAVAAQAEAAAGQVAAAEAAIGLIETQIDRFAIHAPGGRRGPLAAVEPGEVSMPGGALLVLGDLGHLSVTVYLPEDRYGEVHLGDVARVSVDSFPARNFEGQVVRIADQAEFTPRNVQTPAGRRTMVFAVKLALADPGGDLKPGMPADVVFGP